MGSDLATRFLPSLIEQTAICLNSQDAREYAEQRAAAREQFLALRRRHEALRAAIGLIHAELAKLEAAGPRPSTSGLAEALAMFRTRRAGGIAWLDLYCTRLGAIGAIKSRSTIPLSGLDDDQHGMVLEFARQASAFLEIDYNRDVEAAGMAVTCDRLAEQGITSDADAFRVAALRRRFAAAERAVAENGERWMATFEAMAARLEEALTSRLLARGMGALRLVRDGEPVESGPELDQRARAG